MHHTNALFLICFGLGSLIAALPAPQADPDVLVPGPSTDYKYECYDNPPPGQHRIDYANCLQAADQWDHDHAHFTPKDPKTPEYYYHLVHNPFSTFPNMVMCPFSITAQTCQMVVDYKVYQGPEYKLRNVDEWAIIARWLSQKCVSEGKFGGGKVKEFEGTSNVILQLKVAQPGPQQVAVTSAE